MRIKYILQAIESLLYIIVSKLFGNKINVLAIVFISYKATIRTNLGNIKIGYKTAIRQNTELNADGGTITIGKCCFINRNCMIVAHKKIILEDGVTIGPNVCIYDHDHDGFGGYNSASILIKKNTWIGAGCIILKGVTIGENCIIGAGSLIAKDVPDNTLVYQKRINQYINRSKK